MSLLGKVIVYLLVGICGLTVGVVAFLGICALAVREGEYETHSRFYRRLLNGATAFAVWLLGIHVHCQGLEKLPQGRFLLVGNHRSNFDPIVTWYALKDRDLAFLSKAENFKIPIFGRIIRKCYFLPIDRQDPRKAMTAINQAAALLENDQVSIGVYPEGTRSKECVLLPFHNGVFENRQKGPGAHCGGGYPGHGEHPQKLFPPTKLCGNKNRGSDFGGGDRPNADLCHRPDSPWQPGTGTDKQKGNPK